MTLHDGCQVSALVVSRPLTGRQMMALRRQGRDYVALVQPRTEASPMTNGDSPLGPNQRGAAVTMSAGGRKLR
ncbi:hypothetical protein IG631_15500 [Alternaria alternata]|nr:hypothetical protein IG631_15500 [Alternaria alternata]